MILGQKRGHAVIVPSNKLNIEIVGRLGPRDVVQVNCRVHERRCLSDCTSEAHDLVLGRAIANENDHHNLLNWLTPVQLSCAVSLVLL